MTRFLGVYPIGDEDVKRLPVKSPQVAAAFYRGLLGFSLVRDDGDMAMVERDVVRIGLKAEPNHEPGRAGSLAIEVDDLEALHRELEKAGAAPGEFGVDEWNGRSHRTFFVREEEDGYCYCFFRPL
jgi:catechol 2,3-dioxygenase-like lactoylglutathione lyase family enzyme